ncbi:MULTISPECIES: hydantoinase/oxoprolinase family protein [Rhizobium/Agrobacterium group]|uniref:Hydantoin utilization protein n=2 Tax=Rhizobium/Agrobacterium group TaxID=227290 RepID=B9K3Y6_ALLAM|nr:MULTISPECIES: hydantoinase/oxoprolinase family protein [Rhizobium/Agrobacterium group]ACM39641.1 hydantoin utilization protein [Allorhizobium ampelinum S4]ASK49676.1 phosphatidylinositol kinase [Agrobacterium vitis]MCF1436715.1 hydantoinase/oxoprolinase family protein [Allorhizobium ampelinum]MCF1450307.1 hydantoinase/oxoprolinase family protein [Allorhizobium ampelinum]MCF1495990.1 hydantoinase/oxoprolinase family protein [Allorhizobium ampelinum]
MGIRIGSDTGGTHTDLVLLDDDQAKIVTLKVPTTPEDLSNGIAKGIETIVERAGSQMSEVDRFVYGTTLVTNLIVEEQQVDIGLITTGGFRDVLEIGRASRRPNVYDIHWRPPTALISRDLRVTVNERISADGSVITPIDDTDIAERLSELKSKGVRCVAVCLMNSYTNPEHEQRIGKVAAEKFPDLAISLSCEVAREFREYERTSTTAINAFVGGPLTRHLDGLAAALAAKGITPAPYIIRGNGGVMSFTSAKKLPAALTHSGPMGGIIGGAALAEKAGVNKIITLDMGGTSADVSLLTDGKAEMTTRSSVGRHPLLLPMLDLITIGAGGGSIAWVDQGGALRLGPRSAGSVPGPACYGQGGENPTVTDSNLYGGRLNPEYFLAGARKLHPAKSREAILRKVAEPCGISLDAAASGIMALAEAHMVNAIKLITVQRGLDPRDYTLVGFGGAGPLHTLRLAEELGIRSALIPPAPGNLSALGMLTAQVRHDLVRTKLAYLGEVDAAELSAGFDELIEQGEKALADEDIAAGTSQYVTSLDLRYKGQNFELNLELPAGDMQAALDALQARFAERHKQMYGYDNPGKPIQIVNMRVAAMSTKPDFVWPTFPTEAGGKATVVSRRKVLIDAGHWEELPIYRLDDLREGYIFPGASIVEYPGSTLFVPPGWTARCDAYRILHLER